MKNLYAVLICLLLVNITNAQDRFLTKNGEVTFFSSAPMEDIKADNNQVLSIIDATKGNIAISILMKSFMFEKALMQEHFNENYVESDKYPKAIFKGAILNFNNLTESETKVEVKGAISIHGKTKEIIVPATITKTKDSILLTGEFFLKVADFDIKIPKVVVKNIAKDIKVIFQFNYKPYQK
ncbi:YceI family protein [uncultured Polaribacter sp.]|uniref:YceI family protein n=1 Tax=uncultured Polaribacter sp. TaxID=174711 RepID=UPI00260F3713|nr:YceI family protein [uncultured Polaribacter sp.]